MFLPSWRDRFSHPSTNRAARRRRKHQARLQTLEPRSLLSVTPTAVTFTPIEQTAFSGTVASFTADDAGPFSASIDWGDGTITPGTVTANGGGFDVSDTHTYAEDGIESVSVVIADSADSTTATAASTASISENAFGLTAGPAVTATEGVAISGVQVATFSDPGSPDAAGDFGASIAWGDGTTTAGTITGSGGNFTVTGDHTYADELNGNYAVTVFEPSANFTFGPASAAVTVAEGDSGSLTSATFTPTEGQVFSGAVATFTDNYTGQIAGDFTASVDWGDGTTTAGTVTGGSGTFTISGEHTYADEGTFSVLASFADNAPSMLSATITSSAVVAEADAFTPGFVTTGAIPENQFVGGTAAVFHNVGFPTNDVSDFTGAFDWGDGTVYTTTDGNVTLTSDGAGNITLSVASHSYADEGVYAVVATVADDAPGTASGSQTGTLTVTETDAFTPSPTPLTINTTEGTAFSGNVAVFADTGYPDNDPSDFIASIDWGDGTIDAGTVSTSGDGNFTVSGSHTYVDDGSRIISTTINDDAPGIATATTTATAHIAEADLTLTPAVATFVTTEGATASGTVATITDLGGNDPASDFTAMIDWGDGTTTAGTITGGAGTYLISGSHSYADEGLFNVSVAATETSPGATATATMTANVVEGDTFVAGSSVTASTTEASAFTATVATFSNTTYAGNTTSDFNAMIDWGDGTTSAGTISGTAGDFAVKGSHTYAEEGTFKATVVVSDDAPGTATGTATATIEVADAPLSASGVALSGIEGAAFNTVIANFTDADPAGTASDYTATVNWGDGTTALGTISADGSGGFQVSAAHRYAEEGALTITVTITDAGGSTATATSTIQVSDAALVATAATVTPTEGIAFTGTVASFTDTDPAGTASDYTATISWGDGTTALGTISANAGGRFDVSATHVYAEEGSNTVRVVINDNGGASATAVAAAQVSDAPLSATAAAVVSPEFATFSGVVASFTDADSAGTLADYTATIDWGDGSAPTAGSITAAGGSFDVSGSHAYAEEGSFIMTVTIADVGGSTTTVSRAATITESPITGSGVALAGFERSSLTNITVATFQHGDGGEPAGNFTATIQWGDGSSSVGTISQSGTAYSVSGSHIYLDERAYPIVVQVSDDAASATFASSAKISEELLPNGTVGTPNQQFIAELYRDLLHRPVDSTALPYWSNLLDQGQSRQQVAQAIINASMPGELGEDLVRGIYETLLNRDPDAAGLAFWMNTLNQGTIEQTEAKIAGTQEFFADSGGTNDGFVTHLFQVALERTPEASARAAFDASLASGMSREQMAAIVFGSHEYHLREIAGYYQSSFDLDDRFVANVPFIDDLDFLDRAPDAGGLAGFTSALDHGTTDQQVWAQFIASDEFFAKL